jgi:hypothetical protein
MCVRSRRSETTLVIPETPVQVDQPAVEDRVIAERQQQKGRRQPRKRALHALEFNAGNPGHRAFCHGRDGMEGERINETIHADKFAWEPETQDLAAPIAQLLELGRPTVDQDQQVD